MSATALFLLLGLVLAFAGVFATLFSGEKRVATRATETAPRRRALRTTTPAAGSAPGRAPVAPGARSRPLSRREREAMLDGIQNLVRDNPARTAALVRTWLNA